MCLGSGGSSGAVMSVPLSLFLSEWKISLGMKSGLCETCSTQKPLHGSQLMLMGLGLLLLPSQEDPVPCQSFQK